MFMVCVCYMKEIRLLHSRLMREGGRGSKCDCVLSETRLLFPIDIYCMRLLGERDFVRFHLERSTVDEFP